MCYLNTGTLLSPSIKAIKARELLMPLPLKRLKTNKTGSERVDGK